MNYSKEDIKHLKIAIKNKFGTLKHFAYCSGLDYYLLNKFFGRKLGVLNMDEMKKNLPLILESTECKPHKNMISDEERENLRRRILVNYRSVNQFITDNPHFSKSFISNVINGRRKKMDNRFHNLKNAVLLLNVQPEQVLNS